MFPKIMVINISDIKSQEELLFIEIFSPNLKKKEKQILFTVIFNLFKKNIISFKRYYWSGFVAFALRIAAWSKQRLSRARKEAPDGSTPLALKALGSGIIAFGLVVAATGLQWQKHVTEFLTAPEWSTKLELWLPYWPFEPYLSLFIIGFGAMLLTMRPEQTAAP